MKVMKGLMIVAVVGLLMSGCATWEGLSPKTKTGAGIGAVGGGILGAMIDSNKPWRGAIIGAAAGAAAGGWVGHTMDNKEVEPVVDADANIVNQAALDAAKQNATVKYSRTTENGINEEVIATPGELKGNARVVTIRYYRDGQLISTEIREVVV